MALYKEGKRDRARDCLKKATATPADFPGKDVAKETLARMT
jgi:hypothetical protein